MEVHYRYLLEGSGLVMWVLTRNFAVWLGLGLGKSPNIKTADLLWNEGL